MYMRSHVLSIFGVLGLRTSDLWTSPSYKRGGWKDPRRVTKRRPTWLPDGITVNHIAPPSLFRNPMACLARMDALQLP